MKRFSKRVAATLTAVLTCATAAMQASAITYYGTVSKTHTDGGTDRSLQIDGKVFIDYYSPSSSVTVYYYGIEGSIADLHSSEVETTFTIKGNNYKDNSATPFSSTGTDKSWKASTPTYTYQAYDYCAGTIDTYSPIYGKSSQDVSASYTY